MTTKRFRYLQIITLLLLFSLLAGCEKEVAPVKKPGEKNEEVTSVTPDTVIKEVKERKGYTIVVESVPSGSSFSPLAEKLKERGIEIFVITAEVGSEKRDRLCAGNFTTPEEAEELKARLKNEFGITNAWRLKFDEVKETGGEDEPTDPAKLINLIRNGKVKVVFHATFTEPFLNIFLTEKEFLLVGMGEKTTALLQTKFDPARKLQTVTFIYAAGNTGSLVIENKPGSDGMSDTKYTYTVFFEPHYGGGTREMRYPPWKD